MDLDWVWIDWICHWILNWKIKLNFECMVYSYGVYSECMVYSVWCMLLVCKQIHSIWIWCKKEFIYHLNVFTDQWSSGIYLPLNHQPSNPFPQKFSGPPQKVLKKSVKILKFLRNLNVSLVLFRASHYVVECYLVQL